jgi:DNA-binding transcriptional MerR regulator
MEYSIKKLSEIAGVSTRTLRYYDQINLLKPAGIHESGYRYYDDYGLNLLQQILFYKENGLKLNQISQILHGENFDIITALYDHLDELEKRQIQINNMITTVRKSILSMKGEITMSNEEKFESLKKDLVSENERKYGEEVRTKYGDGEMEASSRKMMDMTKEDYDHFQKLEESIKKSLEEAVKAKESPQHESGKEITGLHKEWLSMTLKQYSASVHKGIAQMYEADSRFTQYYDENVAGCAKYLNEAVNYWADKI